MKIRVEMKNEYLSRGKYLFYVWMFWIDWFLKIEQKIVDVFKKYELLCHEKRSSIECEIAFADSEISCFDRKHLPWQVKT